MKFWFSFVVSAAAVAPVTTAAQQLPQVVVFDDTPSSLHAVTAAEQLGWPVEVAANVAQFERLIADPDSVDVVVIELRTQILSARATGLLVDFLQQDGSAIVGYHDLDTNSVLQTALGLTCLSGNPVVRPLDATPAGLAELFTLFNYVPSTIPSTSTAGDLGDNCSPIEGVVFGTNGTGTGRRDGLMTTLGGQAIYHSLVPDVFRSADADSDGIADMAELYANELLWLRDNQPRTIVELAPAPSESLAQFGEIYDWRIRWTDDAAQAEAWLSTSENSILSVTAIDEAPVDAEGSGAEGSGAEGSGAEGSGTEGSGAEGSGTEGSGTEGSGTEGSGAEGSGTLPPDGALDERIAAMIDLVLATDAPTLIWLRGDETSSIELASALTIPTSPAATAQLVAGDRLYDGYLFDQPIVLAPSLPAADSTGLLSLEPSSRQQPAAYWQGGTEPGALADFEARRLTLGVTPYALAPTDEAIEFLYNAVDSVRRFGSPTLIASDADRDWADRIREAAFRGGSFAVVTDDAAAFAATWEDGWQAVAAICDADCAVATSVTELPSFWDLAFDARSRVVISSSPMVHEAWKRPGSDSEAHPLVAGTTTLGTQVLPTAAHLGGAFSAIDPLIEGLSATNPTAAQIGVVFNEDVLEGRGPVAVWPNGQPAGVALLPQQTGAGWNTNGLLVHVGIAPSAYDEVDADDDLVLDLDELISNLLGMPRRQPTSHVVFADSVLTPESLSLDRLARFVGFRPYAAGLDTAPDESVDTDWVFLESSGTDADEAAMTAWTSWLTNVRGDVRQVFYFASIEGAELFADLGITGPAGSARATVLPYDVFSDTLFTYPYELGYPLAVTSPAPAIDFDLAATSASPLLRWTTTRGPVAGVVGDGGRTVALGLGSGVIGSPLSTERAPDDGARLLQNLVANAARLPTIVIDVPRQIPEGTELVLDASRSFDSSGLPLTCAWDLDGDREYDDATGPVTTFDATLINGDNVRTVRFAIRCENAAGLFSIRIFEPVVLNVAPTVVLPEEVTIRQDEFLELVVEVFDVPGDTVGDVTWDFGDGTTDVGLSIVHEYAELGQYDVSVTVSDGEGATTVVFVVVNFVNAPPEISIVGDLTAINEGDTITLEGSGTDPGGDEFEWAWQFEDAEGSGELPPRVDGSTAEYTYRDNGVYTITLYATETVDTDSVGTASVQLTVNNVDPTIANTAPEEATELEEYAWQIEVTDPGDDTFTYALTDAPEGMAVSEDGLLTWTPDGSSYAEPTVLLTVADDDGGEATYEWTIDLVFIDDDGGGAPDRCEDAFGFDSTSPDDDLSDADGDGLTLAEECITGTDPTVFSGPPAPELLEPADGGTVTAPEFDFVWSNVVDPDGDPLTYEVELYSDETLETLLDSWQDVQVRSGATSFVRDAPSLVEDNTYWWRVRGVASDTPGQWGGPALFNFNQDHVAPSRPIIDAPGATADSLTPTVRLLNSNDPDGDTLTYDLELFAGAGVGGEALLREIGIEEGADGVTEYAIPLTLTENDTYTLRVRAVDDGRPSRSSAFEVRTFVVDSTNVAPSAPVLVSPIEDDVVSLTGAVALAWLPSEDEDGDDLTYKVELATDAEFTSTLVSTVVEPAGDEAQVDAILPLTLLPSTEHFWRVQADDGRNRSDFASASFVTAGDNSPPAAPELLEPMRGARIPLNGDGNIVLRWASAVDSDPADLLFYEVQVASRVTMDALLTTATGIPDSSTGEIEYEVDLNVGQSAFWRVRANDGRATGDWSEVFGFTVVESESGGGDTGVDTDAGAGSDADDGSDAGFADDTESDGGESGIGSDSDSASGGSDGGCSAHGSPTDTVPLWLLAATAAVLIPRVRRRL